MVGCAGLGLVLAMGCAKAPQYETTITNLEREVARLKAERANLDARSATLDDKIVVLEKRLEKCADASNQPLTVVRLTPNDDDSESLSESAPDDARDTAPVRPPRKRPVLVLDNSGGRRNRRALSPDAQGSRPLRSATFGHLGPDNLGVVPQDGADSSAEADDDMTAFNAAYQAYSNKRYVEALEGFARFVNGHPNHAYADNGIYWRAECYLAMGKLTNAIGEFQRLARRYPRSEKVAASVFKIGMIYDRLRDFGKATDYYYKVVEQYPGTNEARRASRRVAEIRNRSGNVSELLPTSATR
jgi:tol-pal system protein YbgF